jgi:hypothetical protein
MRVDQGRVVVLVLVVVGSMLELAERPAGVVVRDVIVIVGVDHPLVRVLVLHVTDHVLRRRRLLLQDAPPERGSTPRIGVRAHRPVCCRPIA